MDIIAELKHPEIQGPPLERGTRYGHHFVVELISDGRRLWAVASEEGRKILHQIEHGIGIDEGPTVAEWVAAGYSAKNYPPTPYPSRSTQEEIDAAIAAENADDSFSYVKAEDAPVPVGDQSGTGTGVVGESLDPEGKPATGGDPEPTTVEMPPPNLPPQAEGEAPTTTVSPANTFDS